MTIRVLKEQHYHYYAAAAVALAALLVYLTSLRNGFVNWDDTQYLLDNPHINAIDTAFLRWAFFDFYANNWHPLTWLSHALDHAVWGLNPVGHHLTSIILHAANTFLLVVLAAKLVRLISDDTRFTLTAAVVTGVLFGLHPVHVESVAWVSERKDLLCALFYLLTVVAYMEYAAQDARPRREKGRWYALALCFSVLALMSKPMAVTLPFALLILDWYPLRRSRPAEKLRHAFIEKIPFMVLSLGSMVLTLMAQSGKAIQSVDNYLFSERVFVAAESLAEYIGKMLVPVDLIPFYPYPENIAFPSVVYVSVIALPVMITGAAIALSRRQQWILSAWGYYWVTLVPVLGLVQVGGQAMADRYTYLPSVGPFLLAGLGAAWIVRKAWAAKRHTLLAKLLAASLLIVAGFGMTFLTIGQISIWKSSIDLWSYEIEKEPGKVRRAYINRSAAFCETGQYDRAIADYDVAVALWPLDSDVYYGRGLVYSEIRRYDKAISDFDLALQIVQDDAGTSFSRDLILLGRGHAFLNSGQRDLAVNDFRGACELGNSDACDSLRIFGTLYDGSR